MIAALLLGREGSVGFPGKNVLPVLGRPLMEYPILAATGASSVDQIYVSTDSVAIKEITIRNGAIVIDRPAYLCSKTALGEDAYVHGYYAIKEISNETIELMVLLHCNAATVSSEIIEQGIAALRADPTLDSAVSVSRYNMWSPLRARRLDENGLLQPFVPLEVFGDPSTLNCDRDSQGDVLFADMGVSIVRPRCLEKIEEGLLPQKWMGKRIFPLRQEAGFDVDYEWQVPGVEWWLQQNGIVEKKTE
ncbi:MAG: cytidylyltransferase [Magnetococcales bacterium]|nr:cytidylyltransferase [Magnetococcales bacterium]